MSAFTPNNLTPIRSIDQLKVFTLARCKKPDQWRIGTEHEKFGFVLSRQERPKYLGEIEEIFFAFEKRGWQTVREVNPDGTEGAIISLQKNAASITLEPGGQLELSGAPFFFFRQRGFTNP